MGGTDVVSYLAEKSTYSEQMGADITLQVLDALDYIQWRGRVYLNLEPANVLVCSGRSLGKTVQVKLANFETTQTVSKSGTQIKGTYNFDYAAPEILDEAQAFPQSDIWSLGVLLYVLLSGQLPFKGETAEETKSNILDVKFKFEWLYNEVTMEATQLLMRKFKIIVGSILQITCLRKETALISLPIGCRNSLLSTTGPDHALRWIVPLSFPNLCN